jgi:hypothetical protein
VAHSLWCWGHLIDLLVSSVWGVPYNFPRSKHRDKSHFHIYNRLRGVVASVKNMNYPGQVSVTRKLASSISLKRNAEHLTSFDLIKQ